jgi:hypothetical protein
MKSIFFSFFHVLGCIWLFICKMFWYNWRKDKKDEQCKEYGSRISFCVLSVCVTVFVSFFLFTSADVFAIGDGQLPGEGNSLVPPDPEDIPDEISTDGFRETLLRIINYFLGFVGIISVAALIYFGFLWITSVGNEDQVSTGRKGIIYVALGIIVILVSYVLVDFLIDIGNG